MSLPFQLGKHRTMDRALKKALMKLYRETPFTKVALGPAQSCRHHGVPPGHLEELQRTATSITYKAFDERGLRTITVLRPREG